MKIAIVGLAGAGKDTFGEMLVKHLGSDWELAKYATPLKELTRSIFGDDFDDREVKEVKQDLVHSNTYDSSELFINMQKQISSFLVANVPDLTLRNKCYDLWDSILSRISEISPRQFQQLFGTEVMRSVDNNFWVDQLMSKQGNLIITDARFENEIDKVDWVFLITNPNLDIKDAKYDHASEQMAKLMTAEAPLGGTLPDNVLYIANNADLKTLDNKAFIWATLIKNVH